MTINYIKIIEFKQYKIRYLNVIFVIYGVIFLRTTEYKEDYHLMKFLLLQKNYRLKSLGIIREWR